MNTFGVVGTGVIGAGWATRALSRGLDVVAWDPAPGAEDRLRSIVARAWPSVAKLGLYEGASPLRLRFCDDLEELCAAADFIQESAPEDEELKRRLLASIDVAAPAATLIASSTSGLMPSGIAGACSTPERVVVGHPFNPVYLLPLVEVVGGEKTSQETVDRAVAVYEDLDMYPLVLRREVPGHLSDRLQEAMWRETLHMVSEGVATTAELDDAITYGPGLRWAGFGTNLTFHLAGGDHGMRHMLHQFGPTLKLPWTKLEAPELTEDLIDALVEGTERQADGQSIDQLERQRDDYLIGVMRALRSVDVGAGRILARREARRYDQGAVRWQPGDAVGTPLELHQSVVEPEWVDYNGHMTEAAFLTTFGWASDALFRYVGDDEAYRAGGHTFFTVETHINYLREVDAGDLLHFQTQLIGLDEKRLHLHHTMSNALTGQVFATTEQMLLHVDTTTDTTTPILEGPAEALSAIWKAHKKMKKPPNVGRAIGMSRG